MSEKRVTVQKVGWVLKKAFYTRAIYAKNPRQEGYIIGEESRGTDSAKARTAIRVEFWGPNLPMGCPRYADIAEEYRKALDEAGLVAVLDTTYYKPALLVTGYKQEQAPKGEGERGEDE